MKCHLCAEEVIFKTIPGSSGLTTKGIENKTSGNIKDKYNFQNCITDKNKFSSHVSYSLNVHFKKKWTLGEENSNINNKNKKNPT